MSRPSESIARSSTIPAPDARLVEALKLMLAIGVVLVLLLPAARGSVSSIGWLPLWLLGMPMAALCAVHGVRWPTGRAPLATAADRPQRSRRTRPQARRWVRPVAARAAVRAA